MKKFMEKERISSGKIHVYNCGNCKYKGFCAVDRIDYRRVKDLRKYFCFNHSHYNTKIKADLKTLKEDLIHFKEKCCWYPEQIDKVKSVIKLFETDFDIY